MKKETIERIIEIILIIIIAIVCWCNRWDKTTAKEHKVIYYTVQSGDTLWSIAEENGPASKTIKQYYKEIEQLNNMTDADIRAGQQIKIEIEK